MCEWVCVWVFYRCVARMEVCERVYWCVGVRTSCAKGIDFATHLAIKTSATTTAVDPLEESLPGERYFSSNYFQHFLTLIPWQSLSLSVVLILQKEEEHHLLIFSKFIKLILFLSSTTATAPGLNKTSCYFHRTDLAPTLCLCFRKRDVLRSIPTKF